MAIRSAITTLLLLHTVAGQRCHKQNNESCLEDDKCEWDGSVCYLSYKEVGFGECVGPNSTIPDSYVSDKKLTTLHEGQCEYTCSIIHGCIGVRIEANTSATTCVLYMDGVLQNQPHGFSTYIRAPNGSTETIESSTEENFQSEKEWVCKARYCDDTDCGCDITDPECGDPDGTKGQCGCIKHLDECDPSPCGPDQRCVDQSTLLESQGDFVCTCNNSNHYIVGGPIPTCVIDECAGPACHQGQTCVDPNTTSASVGDFICYCNSDNTTSNVGGPVASCGVAFLDECDPIPCYDGQSCTDPDYRYSSLGDYICTCDNGAGSFVGWSFEDCASLLTEVGNDCPSACDDHHFCIDGNSSALGDYDCICRTDLTLAAHNSVNSLCPITSVPVSTSPTSIPTTNIPETRAPHEKGSAYVSNDLSFVKQQIDEAGLYFNESFVGGVGDIVVVAKNRILVEFDEGEFWLPTSVISLYPWTAVPVTTLTPTQMGQTAAPDTPLPTEVESPPESDGPNIFLFLFIGLAVVLIVTVVVVCVKSRMSGRADSGQEPLVSSFKITGIHELTEIEGIPMVTSTPHPLMASTPKFGFDEPDSPKRAISLASF